MNDETKNPADAAEEIRALKRQMEDMQKRIETLCASMPEAAECPCVQDGADDAPTEAERVEASSSSDGDFVPDAPFEPDVRSVRDESPAQEGAFEEPSAPRTQDAPVQDSRQMPYAAPVEQPMPSPAPKNSPTPPPSYDARAAQEGFYAQPTGQQAYQGNGVAQVPYGSYGQGAYQQPLVRTKDHVAAGLLGIFLGSFGVHKFYLGYNTPGFIMLGVSILGGLLSFGIATSVVWLIGLIEGVIYLVKGQQEFERLYVFGKRDWF